MANGTVYRRGSVFGALLLIAIGGLFLYSNLHPEFNLWPVLARYWPVLIILWGVSKLVDYLALRGGPEAAAAARISGGDIVALIFLLIGGAFFSLVVERGWWRGGAIVIDNEEFGCLLGQQYEFTEEIQQSVTLPTSFSLSNVRGSVTLTPGDAEEIQVRARKTVCAATEAEAKRLAEAFAPLLEGEGGDYAFRWETEAGASGVVRADLEVQVPRTANLSLSTLRGDVRISGIENDVSLTLTRGDAELNGISGDVRVEIQRGDVHVSDVDGSVYIEGRGEEVQIRNASGAASLEGSFYGPIRFAGIGGQASFQSRRTTFSATKIEGELLMDSGEVTLRNVPGEVTLLTRDKEIEVEEIAGELRIENRNGGVLVRAPKSRILPIDVQNRRGSIEVALPATASFEISATTHRGEIESEFTGPGLTLSGEESRDQTLRGAYGKGGPAIRLSTTYGTIYLRRLPTTR